MNNLQTFCQRNLLFCRNVEISLIGNFYSLICFYYQKWAVSLFSENSPFFKMYKYVQDIFRHMFQKEDF